VQVSPLLVVSQLAYRSKSFNFREASRLVLLWMWLVFRQRIEPFFREISGLLRVTRAWWPVLRVWRGWWLTSSMLAMRQGCLPGMMTHSSPTERLPSSTLPLN
jgi:hypothetical protein